MILSTVTELEESRLDRVEKLLALFPDGSFSRYITAGPYTMSEIRLKLTLMSSIPKFPSSNANATLKFSNI